MNRHRLSVVIALSVALLAACARTPGADNSPELVSGEPARCDVEPARLQVDRRVWPEDRMVAKDLGVSVEEAQRRQALAEEAGRLGAELDKNERDTFADLEIKYEPDFRVVAYFTGDGEKTIRPYVRCTPLDGLVEVRRVEASIAELMAAQEEAGRITEELGIRADSDINIQKNRVEVYVPAPERLQEALRASGEELPEHVVVLEAGLARPM